MYLKFSFALFLAIFFISTTISQTYVYAFQKEKFGQCGYAKVDGEIIIKPQFKDCYRFTEDGYALVFKNNKLKLINIKGEIIETEVKRIRLKHTELPPQPFYSSVSIFHYHSDDRYTNYPPEPILHYFNDGYLGQAQSRPE